MDVVVNKVDQCPARIRGEDGVRFINTTGFHTKNRPSEFFLTTDFSLDFPIDDSITVSRLISSPPEEKHV